MTDMIKTAVLSDCGRYRYLLRRIWDPAVIPMVWIMLNPSTADAEADDATIRRCIGYGKAWGHGGIVVVNLYAWRATDPDAMFRVAADIIGPDNDEMLRNTLDKAAFWKALVVAAWGARGPVGRGTEVAAMASERGVPLLCLGTTYTGHPRHPVRLSYDVALEPWSPARYG